MNEAKHTPTPWTLRLETQNFSAEPRQFFIEVADGEFRSVIAQGYAAGLCDEHGGTMENNAHFILTACNQHDKLKAERDTLLKALKDIEGGFMPNDVLNEILELSKASMVEAKSKMYGWCQARARAAIAKGEST